MTSPIDVYKQHIEVQQREDLIVEHLGFVRHILGKYFGSLPNHVDRDNLEGAGVLGLVEAAQQFDEARGVSFRSFAFHRIRGAIVDELRRNSPLSQKMLQQITRVRQAIEQLPPPVMPEEIARLTSLSLDEVLQTIEVVNLGYVRNDDIQALAPENLIEGADAGPQDAAETNEAQQIVAQAMELLPAREKRVLTLYYLDDLRLKEIGKVLQLSESRVSRILAAARFRVAELVRAHHREQEME